MIEFGRYEDYAIDGFQHVRWTMQRGEGIPMHEHSPDSEHTTLIERGSVIVRGSAWSKTMKAGDFYDFAPTEQRHEFEAMEDGTVVLNVQKHRISA